MIIAEYDDSAYGGRFDRSDGYKSGDRYQDREKRDIPTAPPYNAFLGNLTFEVNDEELHNFFHGLNVSLSIPCLLLCSHYFQFCSHVNAAKIKSVTVVKDAENKPRGFAYIEFSDVDSLKSALALDGQNMGGLVWKC